MRYDCACQCGAQVIDDLDEKKKEALRLTWERVRCVEFEGFRA